jgi:aminopeptidase N
MPRFIPEKFMSPTAKSLGTPPTRAAALALFVGCIALSGSLGCDLAQALAGASSTESGRSDERVLLPTEVTPDHYRIEITPNAAALTFRGKVSIDITVHAPTSTIVLNGADLVIDRAALAAGPAVSAITYQEEPQTVTLRLAGGLAPGRHTLRLSYHGKIFQQASGLFALDYQAGTTQARALFTQFENSDARRFVPCWDEPAQKATFELTATVPAAEMALSNMPVASTENHGRTKTVHFAATPKMSSYLLFFGLGDFERVHRRVGDVDVGVVAKRGDAAVSAFALDAAAQILPYYNDYFGTPFPLPKLDLIAAPGVSQFFGAMENWGAIFYFEHDLLVDPRISTAEDTQNVYVVVAHEMAHQWFGDLVTMAWWDDIWLNEGFASWMENRVTQHFHPEWNIWLREQSRVQATMAEDEREGTHPIITPIHDVFQASEAFDNITYVKGEAVIRMLEAYAGPDEFRRGVRAYMHHHAYGNTVSDDLWKEMDRGSARPLTDIAHDFTLQAGVPMINGVSSSCEGDRTHAQLSQTHFAIDPASTSATLWHVPVTTGVGDDHETTVIAGGEAQGIDRPGCGALILNAGQTGYFRSRYSPQDLSRLTEHYGSLAPEDQLGLLHDSSALAFMGEEPMANLLELVRQVPPDADPLVVLGLVHTLESMDRLFDGLPQQAAFRSFAIALLSPALTRIGWSSQAQEADSVALLRAALIGALSGLDDAHVVAEGRSRFADFLRDSSTTPADMRHTLFQLVALHADAETWDQLQAMAVQAKTELERREVYALLGTAEDPELARRALDLAFSGKPPATVTPQIIAAVAHRHPEMAFAFATSHWDRLAPYIEPASQPEFVPRLISNAYDPALIGRLDAFAAQHIPSSAWQNVRKAKSNIRYNADIRTKRLPEVVAWVEHRSPSA